MKKKIVSLLLIFVLLFTNYVFADGETEKKLNSIAKIIDNNTQIDEKYSAITCLNSQDYNNKNYADMVNRSQGGEPSYYSQTNKFYITEFEDGNEEDTYINRFITLKFKNNDSGDIITNDPIYITYRNAITYENNNYDIQIVVGGLTTNNIEEDYEIFFQVGRYKKNTKEPVLYYPGIGCTATSGSVNVSIQSYFKMDNTMAKISGLYMISDIDLKQDVWINKIIKDVQNHSQEVRAYIASGGTGDKNFKYIYKREDILNNIYMNEEVKGTRRATDTICYDDFQNQSEGYSIKTYSNTDQNIKEKISDIYLSVDSVEAISLSFQFNKLKAWSNFGFIDIEQYYKIETMVVNGTIDDSIENITKGENKTVKYSPKDETYYLKKITIDEQEQSSLTNIKNEYTFSNIQENHKIKVEYAKKLTVQFNSKGGTAVPTQYVIPSEKATEPAQPTYNGYTFKGWYTDENYTTLYNFNNPVNEDKILYAKWDKNDVYHNITYIVLGNPDDNNATNPDKYKEGDTTKTITNPTKQGYTFSGWFENQELTGTPVTTLNVLNRTDDITLYGRWTINETPSADYTIRHYLEDKNGTITKDGKKYNLSATETKSAKVNSNVTENAKTYVGYIAQNNSLNGVVAQNGSLTLDFYYDKIQYTVTFDSRGGTPVPDQQTKKYRETVTKPSDPTKNGYGFLYWYEVINGVEVPYDFTTPITSNKTLIAKWQEIIPEDVYHNIYYRIDGELDNSAGNPERFKEGSTTPLTIYNATKHGYTFSGWYDNQGLNGNKIISLDVSDKTTDITLYGKWIKNKEPYSNYIINHYLEDEDGTVTKDSKKYKLDNTQTKSAETDSTVTENAHTYEGYVAENSSLSGKVTEDGSLVLDFYYNKKQYKITFDSKGGTEVDDQTKSYGEKVDEPKDPTREGYKFLYWYEEINGKKIIYDFDRAVNSDKKLIAEWEEIKIIPDNPNDETKKEETVPTQKTDTTVAQKVIPNTGLGTAIVGTIISIICAFFGIKYFKLRNDMK